MTKPFVVFLIVMFPWYVYCQSRDTTSFSGGNSPLEMLFVPSVLLKTDLTTVQTESFYIAKHKVSQQLWNEIMGTRTGGESGDSLPVRNVSRDEVQLFILWLNQKTGMPYRLPTETEWAYAVHAGILPGNERPLCSDGGDASLGFRLAMDNPEVTRAAEAAKKAEQERLAAEKAAADSLRNAKRENLAAKESYTQQTMAEQQYQGKNRQNTLPPSLFFTLNAAYTSMPQWSFGFKVGTVKFFGWYLSVMTNFNYKGAFSSFQPNQHYVLTGASKTTYLGGELGLAVRPIKLLSIHIGAGFGYRSMNLESDQGWHRFMKRTYYDPTASLGVMFHSGTSPSLPKPRAWSIT